MVQTEKVRCLAIQKVMGQIMMIGLVVVIALEVFHLVGFHFITVHCGWSSQCQHEILNGLHNALNLSRQDCSEESLVRKFNADRLWIIKKEDVLKWSSRYRGEYSLYENGKHVATDWKIYEIDPLGDYLGRLELGDAKGSIHTVRIVYEIED